MINTNVCLYFNLEALGSLNCSPGIKNAKVVKYAQEEFEDINGVIRIRKSKDRQHNGQKKKDKQRSTCTRLDMAEHCSYALISPNQFTLQL